MKREDIENLIIKYGNIAGKKGYSPGISGNISMRFNDKILITASNSANIDLTKDDIVLIDFEGNSLELDKKASSEKLLHIEIYKKRKDIQAIIHVHSPYLSAFSTTQTGLVEPIMAESVYYFGKIPLAEYGLPSSTDLVDKTVKFFDNYQVVLMANHGVVIGDKTLKDAYLKLDLAEAYANTVFKAKMLGTPRMLSPEQVKAIETLK